MQPHIIFRKFINSEGNVLKIIVVGAGVIGMLQARELALKGVEVVLLDKGRCGREASWAGGGIVSPLYPWRYSNAVTALANWSQAYYPNLVQTLEAESDIDPELTRHGLLMLDVDDKIRALDWSKCEKSWIEEIDAEALYSLEPNLREGVTGGLWMSQVASVRNPRLLKALYVSLDRNPLVRVVDHAKVNSFIKKQDTLKGVVTAQGESIEADAVILCTGAWTSVVSQSAALDVKPVKGQMLLFSAKPGMVNRVVLSNGQYVIPRRDGSVVVGSTLEYSDFDKSTTEQARDKLSDMAINLFPVLATCQVAHHWAGLRPGTSEGIPYIGAVPELDNLYVNAGHFRNGLVLAPASVRLMTSILLGEPAPVDPAPFDPRVTRESRALV